jgi:hypothetical protein
MKSYPRDWIAWSIVAAILIVATVELISTVHATRVSSVAEDGRRVAATDLA